ncbi:MAG: LysR family transcriptional regulator [Pseudomonadales bacterium]|jgi:DNA-binding transcriptional LysR family regulator|nr:LysR family transcriptional regulator [Pseudomonadales bacterium]MCP5320892.1 LysR family transcriptional regulator [Pseudomonadales bacterium]
MTSIDMNTLEQWRLLAAVIDRGGFAQAAEHLCKSQSTISHGVKQLQRALGVRLIELQGRRAVLTPAGETLLRRARLLLADATALQRLAGTLAHGWEARITLAVDVMFPQNVLFAALEGFGNENPETRVELQETVLSGSSEALLLRRADLVITPQVPPGFLGEALLRLDFIAVAHPRHPLHALETALTLHELRQHQQIVVRDSGISLRQDAGWLGAERRLTVSHPSTSIGALCRGLGFAWLPRTSIAAELASGTLKPLPLATGALRHVDLYLVIAEAEAPGPAVMRLTEHLHRSVASLGSLANGSETGQPPPG